MWDRFSKNIKLIMFTRLYCVRKVVNTMSNLVNGIYLYIVNVIYRETTYVCKYTADVKSTHPC